MGKHALLAASSSKRWLNCTPSAVLESLFEEEESVYAKEGSAAHALGEYLIRRYLEEPATRPVTEFDSNEMDAYVGEYAAYVTEQVERTRKTCKDAVVLVEQHLDYSQYAPFGFGTGDLVIVADSCVSVIDLKYGKGVPVSAEWNSQMMLYGLGALHLFEMLYDIDTVKMTIFQPRLESVSTWQISAPELKSWAEEVLKPKAALAYEGKGEYVSGDWCRFCKAGIQCRARTNSFLKLAQMEFQEPALLSEEEIERVLSVADNLKKWAEEVYAFATREAIEHQKIWNGFKLVEGRSNRKYTDEDAVAEAAKEAGYTDIFQCTLLGITEMEKLMGKKTFLTILGKYLYKPKGKVTLVPVSDKREAINQTTAEADFKEEI
ncbi:DUF2800 domain-containing protein [Anaeromicropila populeti]|uniref:DUF2800 domain-containing protein n=1 Tax=Anaeromicropila populeti TaxID=37658 RepID=A0A1I6LE59_9FIRM|nr:DUF2800 domain-containing protein [Anaeromicropila populeti]SFS01560.1 Protein of unknown function [Anaeromicropila populeti]